MDFHPLHQHVYDQVGIYSRANNIGCHKALSKERSEGRIDQDLEEVRYSLETRVITAK